MNNPRPEFNVNSGFIIAEANVITDFDRKIITELYLPLVGPNSISLYFWLLENIPNKVAISERFDHNQILDALNLNNITFVQARSKLEALGLVSTFFNNDQMGDVFVYTLVPPLSPDKFFKDQLLSNFLYSLIGDIAYLNVQKKFALKKLQVPVGENISANFFEVFSRVSDHPNIDRKQIEDLQPQAITSPKLPITFDFDYFSTELKKKGVDQTDIDQNHDALYSLHLIYGFDELELLRFVENHITLDSRKINFEAIKYQLYNMQPTKVTTKAKNVFNADDKISNSQQALITTAESVSPIEFIEKLKEQLGGFVTSGEKTILKNIVENKILSPDVLNILVHQILVGMKNSTINKSLVETIANDWIRDGVTNATQAVLVVNKFNRNKKSPKPQRNNKKLRKVEQKMEYQTEVDDTIDIDTVTDKLNALGNDLNQHGTN